MSDQPLPDMPSPPLPSRPAASPKARYTRIRKPRERQLCDDCCEDIHRLGQAVAPYPKHAVWRRSAKDGSAVLCHAHKDERVADDAC